MLNSSKPSQIVDFAIALRFRIELPRREKPGHLTSNTEPDSLGKASRILLIHCGMPLVLWPIGKSPIRSQIKLPMRLLYSIILLTLFSVFQNVGLREFDRINKPTRSPVHFALFSNYLTYF